MSQLIWPMCIWCVSLVGNKVREFVSDVTHDDEGDGGIVKFAKNRGHLPTETDTHSITCTRTHTHFGRGQRPRLTTSVPHGIHPDVFRQYRIFRHGQIQILLNDQRIQLRLSRHTTQWNYPTDTLQCRFGGGGRRGGRRVTNDKGRRSETRA